MRILVTGATGYIGGRLIPRLTLAGHDVAVLVRDASRFAGRLGSSVDAEAIEVIEGDLRDRASLAGKLGGFDAAYYLVHSITTGKGFEQVEEACARHFAEAVGADGSRPHVIYLGGLCPKGHPSRHLSSRAAVGRTLAESLGGRVTEFRAGPIIGSGSASFEMVRYLTERLPVMLTPRWVANAVQPIAVRDMLSYLLGALVHEPAGIVEVGAQPLSFAEMMQQYAEARGLHRRVIIRTPVLAPLLASRWVGFVTPITNRLAGPLVEGVLRPVVGDTTKAHALFPQIRPIAYRTAVEMALQRVEKNLVETRWTGSLGEGSAFELSDQEGLIREVRRCVVDAPVRVVFDEFTSLGGEKGWPAWTWAWRLRGWVDRLMGGPGLRRGRRHPQELAVGEAVDFWRVERVVWPTLLRLRAEMKLPGKAWLQWEATPLEESGSASADAGGGDSGRGDEVGRERTMLTQTAMFEPKGTPGFVYWYALYPAHLFVFSDMVKAIARSAEARAGGEVRSAASHERAP